MEENQKRLYDHFIATGQTEKAEAFLHRYPHFAEKPATKSKEKD